MLRIGMMSFAHMHAYSYASCLKELEDVELVGIADDDQKRGKEAAEKYGTKYYKSYEQLLRENLDGVIICSENSRHRQLTEMAAEKGVHVLCEKPIATTVEDAQAMIQICRQKGVKLGIAFPCRFSPAMRRAKEMIDRGRIGEILAIMGTNHGRMPGGWFIDRRLAGGGAVMDHTVHVVDLMRWILKDEVKTVYAEVGTLLHNIDIDDCGLLTMEFQKGVFATLDTSWSRPPWYPIWGDVTMEIVGTRGVISLDLFAQTLSVYDQRNRVSWEDWGSSIDLGLIRDFTTRIAQDKPLFITGEDGLRALEVALAAYKSSEEKRTVRLR